MHIHIRQATAIDTEAVSSILTEAADWLVARGMPMWRVHELSSDRIAADVGVGLFFLAERDDEPVGTVKFQLEDLEFWPDVSAEESAFIHRLAVRRHVAGHGVSSVLLAWAADRARSLDRRYLRLDCEQSRSRLREVYETFGFRHHSDRHVGPYFVSRYQLDLVDPHTREAQMSAENVAFVRTWFDEVWNKGQVSAIDEMLSPNGLIHGLGPEPLTPAGFKAFHSAYRNAFPDVVITIERTVAQGDIVAVHWSGVGTHRGDGLGFPATGKSARFSGMTFARIAGDKLVEGWNVFDQFGMLQQIGMIPAS